MVNYVLVHGGNVSTDTWNKLVQRSAYPPGEKLGGKVWDNIANILRAEEYKVFTPTLKDENTYDLSKHIEQICSLIIKNDLQNIILVGHSYGGMVITGVADKLSERIRHLVYLDAALPDPEQSLFDILILGGFDPITVVDETPKAYIEKIQFDPQKIKSLSKTYIICTASEFAPITNLAKEKIADNKQQWNFIELPTSHIPMATMPNRVAQLLLKLGNKS